MRRSTLRAWVLAALLLALSLLGSGAVGASASIGVPLAHAGRWLTDPGGRVVIVHGLNMVYKRPPYAPDAIGFDDDDAAFLAAEGFNTVRLGVIYKAVEPAPGVYDDAYLARIAATVQTLARHGIVSLLDFHQDLYNERFQGEGWPDWAVRDDGLPALPRAGFPANYLVMPALQRAFDHFWANDPGPGGIGLQDRYAAAWRHVAALFAHNPWVLGYDLLNEPWPGSTWQQCVNPLGCPAFDAVMSGFIARTLGAIRQVDPRTLVWYEPNVLFNNGADTNLPPTGDANSGMSFHDYCLTASSGYSPACQASDGLVFANAQKRAQATGDALLLSEFGATDARDTLLGVLNLADRNMTSWQEWHYCGCSDPTTSGPGDQQAVVRDPAQPPRGANLRADTLAVIARPYPQAVSGTPESYSFDPASSTFSLVYSTRRADGRGVFAAGAETEIALPLSQYPHGYGVDVRGATIRSPAGAPVLRLAACAGSGPVSVAVVPAGPVRGRCAAAVRSPNGGGRSAPTRLRVALSPQVVSAGVLVTLGVRVVAVEGRSVAAVPGARVALGDRSALTDRGGRARLTVRLAGARSRTVVARARGHLPGRAILRVLGSVGSLTG